MQSTSEHLEIPPTPIRVLLTVDEAAAALSLGRTYLYRLLMSKEITSVKVGRVRRVPVSALTDYVARRLAE
jgi:excisionase family DNA binding protein